MITKERKQSILRDAYEENSFFYNNMTFSEFLEYYEEWKCYSTISSLANFINLKVKKDERITNDTISA